MGQPESPARSIAKLLARLGVAAVGIWAALRIALPEAEHGILRALADAWQVPPHEALLWFGVAWGILGANLAVGALRFRLLLRGGGLDIPIAVLFRAYLVATFWNLVLPGAILGDVYRFWDARRHTGRGSQVLGMIVLERLMSLAALGAIALAVAPAVPLVHDDRGLLWLLVAAGGGFVVVSLGVLAPAVNRVLRRVLGTLASWAPRAVAAGDRALAETAALPEDRALLARVFGLSLVNQVLPILALVVLAVPLGALVPWYWFAVIVPFVTLVSLFPISIGGAGVREILFVTLFGAVGMRPEAALALSLSVFAAALLWGLMGLGVFLWGRRVDPALVRSAPSDA